MWCCFDTLSFFPLSFFFLSDIATTPFRKEKKKDSAGEQRLACEISDCYRLLSEEPSEQTEANVASVRIPFHTLGNQKDLELGAAAVNAEKAAKIINVADFRDVRQGLL